MRIAKMGFSRDVLSVDKGLPANLFKGMLDLMPLDTRFAGCSVDPVNRTDYLFFYSDEFKDTPAGGEIPFITPWFRTDRSIGMWVEKIDFGDAKESVTITIPNICHHYWLQSQGLFEVYEYCSKCNARK